MIYIIMGKSATGKDTVFSRLMNDKELGLKKIIPYTIILCTACGIILLWMIMMIYVQMPDMR